MKTKLLLFLFLTLFCAYGYAEDTNDLSQDQLLQFKTQATKKVNQFNDAISIIASKKQCRTRDEFQKEKGVKKFYINEALKLFIGHGKESVDLKGEVIPAPQMEVSNIRRHTLVKYPVPTYLRNLSNLPFYTEVKVTSSDAYFVSDAIKTANGLYEATLSYSQTFYGIRDGVIVYKDKVDKTIKVYIEVLKIDDLIRCNVFLGDISVKETVKI
jgi:hypothetical protein